VFTNTTLGLYLNATFFNETKGYKVPMEPVKNVVLNFTSSDQILVDTSRYTVDSVILTLQDEGLFNFTLTQELLGPFYGPEYLNTTYMDGILPGLIAHYGANQPMSINF
jgi:hypothetical protein